MKEKLKRLDDLLLPLVGIAIVFVLWYASSKTWSHDLPTPGKTWTESKPYVIFGLTGSTLATVCHALR